MFFLLNSAYANQTRGATTRLFAERLSHASHQLKEYRLSHGAGSEPSKPCLPKADPDRHKHE